MIKITNIKLSGSKIYALVIPYSYNADHFNIEVDIHSREIVKLSLDENMCGRYHKKARNKLLKMYDEYVKDIPDSATVAWM